MAKKPFSEQFQKESEVMIKATAPFISKMVQNKTLTVEKVDKTYAMSKKVIN